MSVGAGLGRGSGVAGRPSGRHCLQALAVPDGSWALALPFGEMPPSLCESCNLWA